MLAFLLPRLCGADWLNVREVRFGHRGEPRMLSAIIPLTSNRRNRPCGLRLRSCRSGGQRSQLRLFKRRRWCFLRIAIPGLIGRMVVHSGPTAIIGIGHYRVSRCGLERVLIGSLLDRSYQGDLLVVVQLPNSASFGHRALIRLYDSACYPSVDQARRSRRSSPRHKCDAGQCRVVDVGAEGSEGARWTLQILCVFDVGRFRSTRASQCSARDQGYRKCGGFMM